MERDSATASAPHLTTPRLRTPSSLLHPHQASSPHVPPPHPSFQSCLTTPSTHQLSSHSSATYFFSPHSLLLHLFLPPPIQKSRPLSITSSADLSLSITFLTPALLPARPCLSSSFNTLRPARPCPPHTPVSALLLYSSPSATPFFPFPHASLPSFNHTFSPTLASLASPRRVGFRSLSLRPVERLRS